MRNAKCPVCGCIEFYMKDPADEYETYEFEYKDGVICFNSDVSESEIPEIEKFSCETCQILLGNLNN